MGSNIIKLRFSSIDDQRGCVVQFFSLFDAQREVKHRMGSFECGLSYAISDDGIVKVEIVDDGGIVDSLEDLRMVEVKP